MLSNAHFLAKFRFDTAENEPAKNLQNFANFPNFANPNDLTRRPEVARRAADLEQRALRAHEEVVKVGHLAGTIHVNARCIHVLHVKTHTCKGILHFHVIYM